VAQFLSIKKKEDGPKGRVPPCRGGKRWKKGGSPYLRERRKYRHGWGTPPPDEKKKKKKKESFRIWRERVNCPSSRKKKNCPNLFRKEGRKKKDLILN